MSEEQRGKISGAVSGRAVVSGQINGTGGISGNVGFGYACRNIISRTTEEWNAEISLIAKKNTIYVYTDYSKDREGKDVPNIKIGDGKAYLIDMPFTYSGGVTQEQIEFWNNKIAVRLDDEDLENMVFYTD